MLACTVCHGMTTNPWTWVWVFSKPAPHVLDVPNAAKRSDSKLMDAASYVVLPMIWSWPLLSLLEPEGGAGLVLSNDCTMVAESRVLRQLQNVCTKRSLWKLYNTIARYIRQLHDGAVNEVCYDHCNVAIMLLDHGKMQDCLIKSFRFQTQFVKRRWRSDRWLHVPVRYRYFYGIDSHLTQRTRHNTQLTIPRRKRWCCFLHQLILTMEIEALVLVLNKTDWLIH